MMDCGMQGLGHSTVPQRHSEIVYLFVLLSRAFEAREPCDRTCTPGPMSVGMSEASLTSRVRHNTCAQDSSGWMSAFVTAGVSILLCIALREIDR